MSSVAWKFPVSYWNASGVWYGNMSVVIMLRRRISTLSMCSSRAAFSTRRSRRYVASGRPAPRYASTGVVCVKYAFTLTWMAGVLYTPARSGA